MKRIAMVVGIVFGVCLLSSTMPANAEDEFAPVQESQTNMTKKATVGAQPYQNRFVNEAAAQPAAQKSDASFWDNVRRLLFDKGKVADRQMERQAIESDRPVLEQPKELDKVKAPEASPNLPYSPILSGFKNATINYIELNSKALDYALSDPLCRASVMSDDGIGFHAFVDNMGTSSIVCSVLAELQISGAKATVQGKPAKYYNSDLDALEIRSVRFPSQRPEKTSFLVLSEGDIGYKHYTVEQFEAIHDNVAGQPVCMALLKTTGFMGQPENKYVWAQVALSELPGQDWLTEAHRIEHAETMINTLDNACEVLFRATGTGKTVKVSGHLHSSSVIDIFKVSLPYGENENGMWLEYGPISENPFSE